MEACFTSSRLTVMSRLAKLTWGGGKQDTGSEWFTQTCLIVSKWGVVRELICKCTQKTAADGERRLELSAAEVETRGGGGKKKPRRCACTRCVAYFAPHRRFTSTLSVEGNALMEDGKSYAVLSVRTKPNHHNQRQKALFETQTQRCAKGRRGEPSVRETRGCS